MRLGVGGAARESEGGGEVRVLVEPIAIAGGPWVGLQESVEYIRYM